MADPRPAEGTPLYVHLPLCVAKCTYCDFYSVADTGQDRRRILDGLAREARAKAPERPRTVFLGGGTPSHFTVEELSWLLGELDATTGFRASAVEVTVECNPESLDPEKASALVALGATRLSIGVQSFRPEALSLFGRVHDAERAVAAVAAARAAGVQRLGVDLIFGWPGQSPDLWDEDLRRALALGPDHLSAYALAFEEGTPLLAWLEAGRVARADEDLELELFLHTRKVAASAGFHAYEISNFARSGAECRHNLGYWRNEPYVGIGPSAVSHVAGTRRGNARSIHGWLADLEAGRCAWEETLSPRARLGETWWLGLRLAEGVDPERARRTAGFEGSVDPAETKARELERQGLLERRGPAYRLSERGLPLADAVARQLLELPLRRAESRRPA